MWWLATHRGNGVEYRTVELRRGDLRVTVSATGNLQPTNQVDVGSELSGTIGAVLVDDNDVVTQGQELARLDTRRQGTGRARTFVCSATGRTYADIRLFGHRPNLRGHPSVRPQAEPALQRARSNTAN